MDTTTQLASYVCEDEYSVMEVGAEVFMHVCHRLRGGVYDDGTDGAHSRRREYTRVLSIQ